MSGSERAMNFTPGKPLSIIKKVEIASWQSTQWVNPDEGEIKVKMTYFGWKMQINAIHNKLKKFDCFGTLIKYYIWYKYCKWREWQWMESMQFFINFTALAMKWP